MRQRFYQLRCSRCGAIVSSCYTDKKGKPYRSDALQYLELMGDRPNLQARIVDDFNSADMMKKCECKEVSA